MNELKKIWSKKMRMTVIIISTFFFVLVFYLSLSVLVPDKYSSFATSSNTQKKVDSTMPVRLRIPKINVDATVEYLGLTPLGAMDAPLHPSDVGWYDKGPRPGENGTAVMDGHSGWKNKIPAVFDNLYKLQKGDKVFIENGKGEIITFVIRDIQTYDQNENARNVFFSTDGGAHLNLITCSGIWNESTKSSSTRLIVFTDKVIE